MAFNNSYFLYEKVTCSASFTDSAGTADDPTGVTFIYTDPNGTTTTLVYSTDAGLVRDSEGEYHVDLTVSTPGIWTYRFRGTGDVVAGEEEEFFVKPTRTA